MQPSVLVNPKLSVRRYDFLEHVLFAFVVNFLLAIARSDAKGMRNDPYLEKLDRQVITGVEFAVEKAFSCAHDLDFRAFDHAGVPHVIPVHEHSFKRNGNDLHIGMRMHPKSFSAKYDIVVQYPECAKSHAFRMVIFGETERMMRVEPPKVHVSAAVGAMESEFGSFHMENNPILYPFFKKTKDSVQKKTVKGRQF